MKCDVDAVVAGAGLWGCTVARRLADAGRRVLVLERRAAVGGNCRSEIDLETDIEIHTYGSHIFHTHNRKVWDYIRRFTDFNGYQHKVLANYKGRIYHLPLGLALINKFFGVELRPGEVNAFLAADGHSEELFDAFFRGYTSKQWGCAPESVDPSVIRRVPVRNNYDTNYFNDYWQGIPSMGYNDIFRKMLDHCNIEVVCNMSFSLDQMTRYVNCPVYYSGPIDALFGYKYGPLPWRSLRFEFQKVEMADYQGTSVVNFTEAEVPYTRIHEFKHYHPESIDVMNCGKTIICREYPVTWEEGDEPYYPVVNAKSQSLLENYRQEASNIPNLVIGGRLGDYRYYDMDQVIANALECQV